MTRLKDNVEVRPKLTKHGREYYWLKAATSKLKRRRVSRSRGSKAATNVSLLAEALITHGIALSRLSHPEQARASFEQALRVAEQAGDSESAGLAALSLVEYATDLSHQETCSIIEHARTLLDKTENIGTLRRLATATFRILFEGNLAETPPDWTNFSLRRAVLRYESNLIRAALIETSGAVTQAAYLLGFKHHQNLSTIIEARHPELADTRKPKRPRRKHIFSPPRRIKKKH